MSEQVNAGDGASGTRDGDGEGNRRTDAIGPGTGIGGITEISIKGLDAGSLETAIRAAINNSVLASPVTPKVEVRADPPNVTVQVASPNAAGTPATNDQALWVLIRNKTARATLTGFNQFIQTIAGKPDSSLPVRASRGRSDFRLGRIDAYQYLRSLAEAYLLTRCAGTWSEDFATSATPPTGNPGAYGSLGSADLSNEGSRLGREVTLAELDGLIQSYLNQNSTAPDLLPYLHRVLPQNRRASSEPLFNDIFGGEFGPCFVELIWSYWHEEAGLVQTMNAISLRFQNRRSSNPDPLTNLALSPLRPLNNLIWGYIQDEKNRLTLTQRAYEYDAEYGLRLVGKAVPDLQPADSRTGFIEQFHGLLAYAARYYREQSDRNFTPDPYPLLTSLKELHQLLAMGAHNQYGDLPWTARVEMLLMQWILEQEEIREFLGNRPMVSYSEQWMGAVEGMRKLQNWNDAPVTQYRNLAVFGEQILLSVRYADWSNIELSEHAANWARYWKAEIQGYIHAYRAVTGVDLAADAVETRSAHDRNLPPAVHMIRRRSLVAARNGNGRNGSY